MLYSGRNEAVSYTHLDVYKRQQYNRGWGTEKDVQKAIQWFENSDTDYARYALGNIYYRGDDVEQDYEKAFQIFQVISNSAFAEQKKMCIRDRDREEPKGDKIVP